MDAIDRVLMNSRLHHLGMASRITEPSLKLVILTCMDARIEVSELADHKHQIRIAVRTNFEAPRELRVDAADSGLDRLN